MLPLKFRGDYRAATFDTRIPEIAPEASLFPGDIIWILTSLHVCKHSCSEIHSSCTVQLVISYFFHQDIHTLPQSCSEFLPLSNPAHSAVETQWPLGGFYQLSDYLGNKSTWNILIELQLLREIVGLWDEPFLSFPLKTWKVNDRTDDTPPWFNAEVPRAAQTTWQHSNRVTTRRSATQTDL